MGVIVGLELPGEEFVVGEILGGSGDSEIELESVVPLRDGVVPLVRVAGSPDGFRERIESHRSVTMLRTITEADGEVLYALEWDGDRDSFVEGLEISNGRVLTAARRDGNRWGFELLFETSESLSTFQEHCAKYGIPIEIERIVPMSQSHPDREYGLTEPQREAFVAALESGYYAIPRRTSTKELADQLGISDQAVTERLRRATRNLGSNTVLRGGESSEWHRKG